MWNYKKTYKHLIKSRGLLKAPQLINDDGANHDFNKKDKKLGLSWAKLGLRYKQVPPLKSMASRSMIMSKISPTTTTNPTTKQPKLSLGRDKVIAEKQPSTTHHPTTLHKLKTT